MGAFADFINEHKITQDALLQTSHKLERLSEEELALLAKRAEKRAKQADVTYEKAELAKPAHSGKGVSKLHLGRALADQPVSKRVRGKLVRAANELAKGKLSEPLTAPKLFGTVGVQWGKRPKAKKR